MLIGAPMANFSVGDVVKVPFPCTDRPVRQRRPALVVAAGELQIEHDLLWVVMITSAENRGWPEDVPVSDSRSSGLPAPSLVRCAKIATIEAGDAEKMGNLPPADLSKVVRQIRRIVREMIE